MGTTFYRHDGQDLHGPHVRRGMPDVELEILRGRAQNRIRLVREPAFLIGSANDCDLVLGDSQFPEAHSYLLLAPNEVAIRWLGIGPEMIVNGEPAVRAPLCDGDVLETGTYKFRISIQHREPTPVLALPSASDLPEPANDDFDAGSDEVRDLLAAIHQELGVGRPTIRPQFRPQIPPLRNAS